MERPSVVGFPLAEELDPTHWSLGRGVDRTCSPPGMVAAFAVGLGEDKRVVQLHVFDQRRSGCAAVEAQAAIDEPAEHAMIVQPRGFGREHFRFEHGVAAGRIVAIAQQGVARAGTPALRSRDPVALALEGVAGQRNPAALLAGEESREGHRQTGLVGRRRRREERVFDFGIEDLRAGPAETRYRDGRTALRGLRPGEGHQRSEHRVRAGLDDRIHPELRKRLDTAAERHRLARLPAPVARVEHGVRLKRAAAQIADQGDRRCRELELVQDRLEIVQGRLHHGTVVGGTLLQPPHPDFFRLEAPEQRLDVRDRAAHHLVRPVVHRQGDVRTIGNRVVFLYRFGHPERRREHRRHRPLPGQRPDERSARRGESQALFQAEHPRGVRRRDLAEAVTEHDVRPDAEARPHGGERTFQGIDCGLLPLRIVQIAGRGRPSEHHVEQRGAVPFGPKLRVTSVQHRTDYRLGLVERRAHADPLAGLSGVDESHFPGAFRHRAGLSLRQRTQALAQRLGAAEDQPGTMAEVAAANACGPRQVGQQRKAGAGVVRQLRRLFVEPRKIAPGHVAQRRIGPTGERQQAGGAPGRRRSRRARLRHAVRQGERNRMRPAGRPALPPRRLVSFQHHVGVGARPSEPADAGARRSPIRIRPGGWRRRHVQGQPIPVHPGVRRAEMQVLRDDPALHRQHDLDDAGDPGRGLQVTDVGLDRADEQRPLRIAPVPVCRSRRLHLDRVADLRARAMRFDIVDVRGRNTGAAQGGRDHLLLGRAARHGQTGAGAVLVQGRAANHAPDAVTVRLRLGEALERDDAASFAPHVAVRRRIEGGAAPVRREHSGIGAQFQQPTREDRVHAAGKREVGFVAVQAGHRLVDRHERGRTGRIQRQRRPFQAQRVGDPADGGVEGGPGDGIQAGGGLGRLADVEDHAAILVVADPGVDPGAAAPEAFRIDPGVFERPPACLQHQALLRVQHLRLDRRDAEEGGVEAIELFQVGAESAGPGLHVGVGEEFADAPDAGARNAFHHGVHPAIEQSPECIEAIGLGEAARHADNRDGVAQSRAPRVFGRSPDGRSPRNVAGHSMFHAGSSPFPNGPGTGLSLRPRTYCHRRCDFAP